MIKNRKSTYVHMKSNPEQLIKIKKSENLSINNIYDECIADAGIYKYSSRLNK